MLLFDLMVGIEDLLSRDDDDHEEKAEERVRWIDR